MPGVKWCVIVNPGAGSVDDVTELEKSLGRLDSFELKETRGPRDAGALARQAIDEGITHIAGAGGDGTLNEILNGISGHFDQVTLGVLPLGTGNDFAAAIGMPKGHEESVEILRAGETATVDIVRVRNAELEHYFLNTSAGGFTTAVDEKLTAESKDWLGVVAFYLAAARALPDLKEYRLRVKFDDEEFQELNAFNLVVANGRTMGGGVPVAPNASLSDGRMDVFIIPAMPLAKLAVVVPQVLLGRHTDSGDVLHRQAQQMIVSSEPSFDLNADGEIIGAAPAIFDVVPRALTVVINPAEAKAITSVPPE
jgi:diacylglycerol kinase (ATP)